MRIRHLLLIGIPVLAGLASPASGLPPPRQRIASCPEYILTLELRDATGAPIDARVSVLDTVSGQCFGPKDPTEPVYESWSGHPYFYAQDRVDVTVPEGEVRLLVSKGPEYTSYEKVLRIARDQTHTVQLQRIFDATQFGWFSGDTHVHEAHGGVGATFSIDRLRMARVARAEDLNVTCVLSNGPHFNGGIDETSDARHLIHYAMEYRSALYGHMALLGLHTLLPEGCCLPGDPAYPLNRAVCDAAHAQGATVVSAHPLTMDPALFMTTTLPWPYSGFARELPADALTGKIDAIDVFSYSIYRDDSMRELWFDLLNLGLRLPLSVGTDAALNRVSDPPPGGYRVYVRPKGPFTLDSWLEGLRKGRSVATNGPLVLDFTLGGKGLGESLQIPPDPPVAVKGHILLFSREPLERLDIYSNGFKVLTHSFMGSMGWLSYDFALPLKAEPGWVVARVIGRTAAPTTIGTPEQALTSPIYIEVPGRLFAPRTGAVERFDGWIRDLQTIALQRGGWTDPGQMMGVWNDLEVARQRLYGRPATDEDLPVVERPPESETIAVTRTERGTMHIFQATGQGEAVLEIFDVIGRLVRVSGTQNLPAAFSWDSRGENGPVPAGIYFARVRGTSTNSPVERVLVLR